MMNLIGGTRKMNLLMLLSLAGTCGLSACDNPVHQGMSPDPTEVSMDIVSGNSQSGAAGAELPNPVVVRVVNSSGQPLANQIVNFKIKEGGGSIFAGAALTNAQGIAQERWTLGPAGTSQVLEARAVDPATGEKRVFASFTATALDPNTMVASVSVSPTNANVLAGSTQQLAATARSASGSSLTDKSFTWQSSNTTVATVTSSGLVTARTAGSATITATADGKSGSASVVVASAAAVDTIPPGIPGSPTFTTAAVSADSFSVTASWGPATDATRYSWRTGANSGAFDKQGQLTSRTVTFNARLLNDANGYWFCVAGLDAAGNSSEDQACSSYQPPAGSPAPAPAPAPAPSTTVTVATVSVSPTSTSLEVGSTQQLAATVRDAAGTTISGKTITWSSSNTNVATLSSAGVVTAVGAGSATITASVDGKSGTASITVILPSSPPPPPPPSTVGVWYEQNWQSISSLPSNGSAPGIHYATKATIQTGTLFDGTTGRFVRAQYPGGGVEGTAQVALSPTLATQDRPREIWGELWMRVPSDWSIKSDDKTFFHMENWSNVKSGSGAGEGEVWRWAIYLRNGSPYGGPYHRLEVFENFGNIHTSIFNGQWFRLRYHFKMASNTTATDGIYEVWVNDRKVTSRVGIRTDSAPEAFFGSISLGANADPLGSGSRDWGRVRLYTTNPGW